MVTLLTTLAYERCFSDDNVEEWQYKGWWHDSRPKVKPMHLDRPLVAGCTTGYKSHFLLVSGWHMGWKKSNNNINIFFLDMVSIILSRSFHTGVVLLISYLMLKKNEALMNDS